MKSPETWIKEVPVCTDCDRPIQQEEAYYINGEWICPVCLETYKQEVIPT